MTGYLLTTWVTSPCLADLWELLSAKAISQLVSREIGEICLDVSPPSRALPNCYEVRAWRTEENAQRRIFVLCVRPERCMVFASIHEIVGGGMKDTGLSPLLNYCPSFRTSSLGLGTSPVQGQRLDLLFPWKKWLVPTSASSRLQKTQFLPRIFHLLNK